MIALDVIRSAAPELLEEAIRNVTEWACVLLYLSYFPSQGKVGIAI
jgi:hypothetical protein